MNKKQKKKIIKKTNIDECFSELGERLFLIRNELGISQYEMGKLAMVNDKPISFQMISMIENGREALPLANYLALSKRTGLAMDYLLCITNTNVVYTPSNKNSTIGERIKEDRTIRGLTQQDYSRCILRKGGVFSNDSSSVVSFLETEKRKLTAKKIRMLSIITDVPADWFVGLTDERKRK